MDAAAYKKHTTTRGLTYSYYRVVGQTDKPTLVLLHGFPSNSNDWRKLVPLLQAGGYGLIVPDMLGYGGTDKPVEPEAYVGSALSKDIVDVLDAEGVGASILIGHDWGCRVVSRLANRYPERFLAFAFLSVGYFPPETTEFDADAVADLWKKDIGRESFGYFEFFSAEDAASVIESHPESFLSLLYPNPSTLWGEHMCPTGAIRKWVESDRRSPLPNYITAQELDQHKEALWQGGLTAPLNWYKVVTRSLESAENQSIPEQNTTTTKPVLFVATTKDDISVPAVMIRWVKQLAQGPLTVKELDADHWVILSHPIELARDLIEWIKSVGA
ncbi:alpha/beta-hydrolase [Gloeopeniophorella convolvens]|nr:alpha/beta-hydrolase [Gloeopeniophorella convolvens]